MALAGALLTSATGAASPNVPVDCIAEIDGLALQGRKSDAADLAEACWEATDEPLYLFIGGQARFYAKHYAHSVYLLERYLSEPLRVWEPTRIHQSKAEEMRAQAEPLTNLVHIVLSDPLPAAISGHAEFTADVEGIRPPLSFTILVPPDSNEILSVRLDPGRWSVSIDLQDYNPIERSFKVPSHRAASRVLVIHVDASSIVPRSLTAARQRMVEGIPIAIEVPEVGPTTTVAHATSPSSRSTAVPEPRRVLPLYKPRGLHAGIAAGGALMAVSSLMFGISWTLGMKAHKTLQDPGDGPPGTLVCDVTPPQTGCAEFSRAQVLYVASIVGFVIGTTITAAFSGVLSHRRRRAGRVMTFKPGAALVVSF